MKINFINLKFKFWTEEKYSKEERFLFCYWVKLHRLIRNEYYELHGMEHDSMREMKMVYSDENDENHIV